MDFEHETKKNQKEKLNPSEDEMLKNEQLKQREEVGDEIINRVKQIIYEKYPEMEGVEPLIFDEELQQMAPNILERLRELRSTAKSETVDEMERAWKSLLFRKDLSHQEKKLIRRIIAVINRKGSIISVEETLQ